MLDEFDNSADVSIDSTSDGPSESVRDCEAGSSDDPAAPAGWQRRRRGGLRWLAVLVLTVFGLSIVLAKGLKQPEVGRRSIRLGSLGRLLSSTSGRHGVFHVARRRQPCNDSLSGLRVRVYN